MNKCMKLIVGTKGDYIYVCIHYTAIYIRYIFLQNISTILMVTPPSPTPTPTTTTPTPPPPPPHPPKFCFVLFVIISVVLSRRPLKGATEISN